MKIWELMGNNRSRPSLPSISHWKSEQRKTVQACCKRFSNCSKASI